MIKLLPIQLRFAVRQIEQTLSGDGLCHRDWEVPDHGVTAGTLVYEQYEQVSLSSNNQLIARERIPEVVFLVPDEMTSPTKERFGLSCINRVLRPLEQLTTGVAQHPYRYLVACTTTAGLSYLRLFKKLVLERAHPAATTNTLSIP